MLQMKHDIICESRSIDQQFYNESYVFLESAIIEVLYRLDIIRKDRAMKNSKDPIEHCKARIKAAESMKEKLLRRELPVSVENALSEIYDAAGIRVIGTFLDDIYWVANMLRSQQDLVVTRKRIIFVVRSQTGTAVTT